MVAVCALRSKGEVLSTNAVCHAKYGSVCYGCVLYCLCCAGRITVRCGSGREHLEIVGIVVRVILIRINE